MAADRANSGAILPGSFLRKERYPCGKARKCSGNAFGKQRYLQLFALLGIVFILIFYYAPMSGLLMAFKKYKIQTGYAGIFTAPWVGLKWFTEFVTDYNFPQLLRNTLGHQRTEDGVHLPRAAVPGRHPQ